MYVDKIGYYYLRNDYLNPQKNSDSYLKYWWRYSTLKIPHFKGMDNLMTRLIPFFPYCALCSGSIEEACNMPTNTYNMTFLDQCEELAGAAKNQTKGEIFKYICFQV